MSYAKRPPSIETVRSVLTEGPVRIRFAEDTKTWLLDSFTASAMTACYDALLPENKAKIDTFIRTKRGFMKFVNLCWNSVKAA